MLDGASLPNLKIKYTAEERRQFSKILFAQGDEIDTLLEALTEEQIPRYEEFQKDSIAIQEYQQSLVSRGQQHLAAGKALTHQYNGMKAEQGKLKGEIRDLEKEKAALGNGVGSGQNGHGQSRKKVRKGGCVIL